VGGPLVAAAGSRGQGAAPWIQGIRERVARELGGGASDELEGIVTAIASALEPGTYSSYAGHFRNFVRFCDGRVPPVCPLPATPGTVQRWVRWITAGEHGVAAGSLRPYISAVNTVHADCGLIRPGVGPMLERLRTGISREQLGTRGTRPQRLRVRASHVKLVLEVGKASMDGPFIKKAVRVVLGFLFFQRGSSVAGVLDAHLVIQEEVLIIVFWKAKGKELVPVRHVLEYPLSQPGVRAAVELFQLWRRVRLAHRGDGGPIPADTPFVCFTGEARPTTTELSSDLVTVLESVGVVAPSGFFFASHSNRSGGVTAAWAAGVPALSYHYIGGWAPGSDTVARDYIDFSHVATDADFYFFGFFAARGRQVLESAT
jgi:hypothetical protein